MEWTGGATALAVLLVTLAGCSDGGGQVAEPALQLAEVDNTATRGSISGVVVDDAIRPLAGIDLTLLTEPPQSVVTDEDGLFVFEQLDPGLYTISANASIVGERRFLGIQTTADVIAGETAKVRIVLPPDPTPQPYHTTYKFDWYDEAGVALVDFAVDLFGRGVVPVPLCDQCYFEFATDSTPHTFVVEATWQDTVAPPHKEAEYYWTVYSLNVGGYASDYFTNPGRAEFSGAEFEGETDWGINMAAEEEWITYQQSAQLFVTAFYLEPPRDGWSIVAGDT